MDILGVGLIGLIYLAFFGLWIWLAVRFVRAAETDATALKRIAAKTEQD